MTYPEVCGVPLSRALEVYNKHRQGALSDVSRPPFAAPSRDVTTSSFLLSPLWLPFDKKQLQSSSQAWSVTQFYLRKLFFSQVIFGTSVKLIAQIASDERILDKLDQTLAAYN